MVNDLADAIIIIIKCYKKDYYQGHCFVSKLDCLNLKNNHAKFQLNPIRNGPVMV